MKINGNAGGSAWIIPPFIHSLRWLVDWLHWQINFLAAGRHWTQCGAAFWPKAETSFRNWLGGCWSAKWGEVDREHLSKLDDGRCNFSFSNASIWRIDVGVFSFFFLLSFCTHWELSLAFSKFFANLIYFPLGLGSTEFNYDCRQALGQVNCQFEPHCARQ